MLENAKKVLQIINEKGYKAYIVGGFVRDYLLGIESNDIDITTNATPKELQEIFDNSCMPSTDYGAVIINNHGIRYEITTFRKEISYTKNRKPEKIEYIDDLYKDLTRRDFTINTICIDKNGEIIDFLKGRDDLNKRLIKTVGNAKERFEEDSLRILRAIRFASSLDFILDKEIEEAIREEKYLLKNLSYNRKKEELDKMFSSPNAKKSIELLLKFGLDKELELERLKDVINSESLICVWSILNVTDIYPFNNTEKEMISNINEALKLDNYDALTLYKYGLYLSTVVYDINNEVIATLGSEKRESVTYDKLPQVLVDAIIATEDSRFFEHNGVDSARFLKATFGHLGGNSNAGGASTLTMQVVKNNLTSTERSIIRKFKDMYLSVFYLEKKYTKEEIIELYVNGILQGLKEEKGVIGPARANTITMLGANPSGTSSVECYFKGIIHSARIYNVALDEDAIMQNYNIDYKKYLK